MKRIALGSLLLAISTTGSAADLTLAAVFGDHMVLQRGQPITVWGSAAPAAPVTLELAGQQGSATADASGAWSIELPPLPASGPFTLTAHSGSAALTRSDLMIGDLWLASGQSNMVLALTASTEWAATRTTGIKPGIRVCKLPGTPSLTPTETYVRDIPWDLFDPSRVGAFSAVAGYFALTVQPALPGKEQGKEPLTIGVLEGASGGTMAEQWTPEAALRAADPQSRTFALREKSLAKVAADPQTKVGGSDAGAAALYNGTIHGVRHLKFAGVLWYQGEANSRSPDDYRPRLTTLIKSWRELFAEPELPFIIVQLPHFGLPKDDGWMRVQEAQRLVAQDLKLPLVVTIDQGSAITIHPPNKAEVGRRAGLAALQHVYHQAVNGTSPQPTALHFTGATAAIDFSDDLVVNEAAISGFELAGHDQAFVPASASLSGRTITLSAAGITQPEAVRYLWVHSPAAVTLAGISGLPVGPFRFGGAAPQATP